LYRYMDCCLGLTITNSLLLRIMQQSFFAGFMNDAKAVNCKKDCTQSMAKKITDDNQGQVAWCLKDCRGKGDSFLKDIQNFMTVLLNNKEIGDCTYFAEQFVNYNIITPQEEAILREKAGGKKTPFLSCLLRVSMEQQVAMEIAQEKRKRREKYGY
ncbi:MAG: hypothetical protein K2W94_05730, partial [Alphaproteobacteria bacterium]|nr:hypothetical protein [Alphaproteobacteria bacterium]